MLWSLLVKASVVACLLELSLKPKQVVGSERWIYSALAASNLVAGSENVIAPAISESVCSLNAIVMLAVLLQAKLPSSCHLVATIFNHLHLTILKTSKKCLTIGTVISFAVIINTCCLDLAQIPLAHLILLVVVIVAPMLPVAVDITLHHSIHLYLLIILVSHRSVAVMILNHGCETLFEGGASLQ